MISRAVPYATTPISHGCAKAWLARQFWSVWVAPDLPGKEQVEQTLEQIDLVKSIAARLSADLRDGADGRQMSSALTRPAGSGA